jgi:hypothetical protein
MTAKLCNWRKDRRALGAMVAIAATVAMLAGAAPASAAPEPGRSIVTEEDTCTRGMVRRCTPGVIYRSDEVVVNGARTEIRRFSCPEPALWSAPSPRPERWYATWWAVVPEPGWPTPIASPLIAAEGFTIASHAFEVRVHNWGGAAFHYRLYWKCREDPLYPSAWLGENTLTQIADSVVNEIFQSLEPVDQKGSEAFVRNLISLIMLRGGGRGRQAPDNAAAAAVGGATPAGPARVQRRATARLSAGKNLLSVLYPHPTRTSLPPAAVLRLSPAAKRCRANRLLSMARDNHALMAVRLDCPRSAAVATATLEGRATVRRRFALRNGRQPLRVTIPVPRGKVSAYALIETHPRRVPCRRRG